MNKKYEIDEKELIELISSQRELNILKDNGVNNWEGYQEVEEDEFEEEDVLGFIKGNYKVINEEKVEEEHHE